MRSDWSHSTFSELVGQGVLEIGDGYRAKNEELGGQGLIFLRAGHVRDSHIDFAGVERFKTVGEQRFGPKVSRVGDVIVTTKGNSTGRVAFVTEEMPQFVYSPHLSYWRSKSEDVLHQGFLRVWSRSPEFSRQLAAMSRSTDMAPYLSLSDQQRLRIALPPIEHQRQIGELGDALDRRIDLLRQANITLESIAQALFKSWFIDFDPVRSKAEGREPEGMNAEVAALFPAEFEESAVGAIPKGWPVTVVGDVANIVKGRSYKSSELADSETALVTLKSFERGGGFRLDGFKGYTGSHKPEQIVQVGECIVALTDVTQQAEVIGRAALVLPSRRHRQLVASLDVGIVRPLSEAVPPLFLYFLLRGERYVAHIRGFTSGTTVLHLAGNGIPSFCFPLPSLAIVKAFIASVGALWEKRVQNEALRVDLAALRDLLLPRLISGKLRLDGVQSQFEPEGATA